MRTREDRVRIAKETLSISEQGSYRHQGKTVELPTTDDKYLLWEPFDMDGMCLDSIEKVPEGSGRISLANESVIDSIFSLQKSGVDGNKVGVLNFASAKNPGGGFLRGTIAQEEALAYCSDLYKSLANSELYDMNRKANLPYYADTTVTSLNNFFRNSKGALVHVPYAVNIVTCPAVNMRLVRERGACLHSATAKMKERMEKIIGLMINREYTHIILGAYGCGVFENNPKIIAQNWYDIFISRDLRKYFDFIHFAVMDKPTGATYRAFEDVFRDEL